MAHAETLESGACDECTALFEAARPDVYRRNAFRIAALSVEATPRDISRHTEKMRMMQKYGGQEAVKTPLALKPAPDEHAVREALHKLHDPEKRLIDEFFWFWPHQIGQSRSDEALDLLAKGDVGNAAGRWRKMEQSSESYVSMHNLAVLYHCLALDAEQVALNRALKDEERTRLQQYWQEAVNRWKVVIEHEPFWSRLSARIRSLEDPRLTTGLSRRMREGLPLAILSINANLAVRFTESGRDVAAKRQLDIARTWEASKDGQFGPILRKALGQAVEPIRQRIKSICKNAEAQADADPSQGDRPARSLMEQTKPMLAILDRLLPAGDATRDAAHDEIALCVLRCQIPFGNKTGNWQVSLLLLKLALPIAAGKTARDRIEENIKVITNNISYGTCWFCQENPTEDASAFEVKMHGDVTRTPTWNGVQIQWRHGSVKVPRCPKCKKAHDRSNALIGGGGVIGGLLGLASCIAIMSADDDMWIGGAITLAGLSALGAGIGAGIAAALRPKGIRPESFKSEYSSIRDLLAKGWHYGDKPNTQ